MIGWILPALWLACAGSGTETKAPPPASTAPSVQTQDTGLRTTETAALTSPAEAIDLDPSPDVLHVELTASAHTWEAAGQPIDGYAYNGQVPGPTLRMKPGDQLVVDFENDTDIDSSIHWHGLSVPYEMDGAGWQVDPVPPGGSFRYAFTVEQAGTFWYHPHFNTARAVDLGLYGVIVVEQPDVLYDVPDTVVVLDSVPEHGADVDDHGIEPSPVRWLANGLVEPVWSVPSGSIHRLRLVNVSNVGYVSLEDRVVVGFDQGELTQASSSVVLAPGDRAELLWAGGPETAPFLSAPWSMVGPGPGEPHPLFVVDPEGNKQGVKLAWPKKVIPPTPDPGRTDLRYTFTGSPTEGWEINGQTFPDIEPDVFELGTEIVLEIRNLSPVHHPFHLHGMVFEVLAIDGVPRSTSESRTPGTSECVRRFACWSRPTTPATGCPTVTSCPTQRTA